MAQHQATERFYEDFGKLSEEDQELFERAAEKLIEDLAVGQPRESLHVRRVQGFTGLYEMTWTVKGRATFSVGGLGDGQILIWRRVGKLDVLSDPT
jgi:hypothetical protein